MQNNVAARTNHRPRTERAQAGQDAFPLGVFSADATHGLSKVERWGLEVKGELA